MAATTPDPSPLVSIGVPVYNGEQYLEEALDSLVNQTYANLEIIICDNASTDRTEEICRSYMARDGRITYTRHGANIGASRNYNATFAPARGKYFKWQAHDDICHPEMIARCVEVLEADEEPVLAYPGTRLIEANGSFMEDFTAVTGEGDEPRPSQRLSMLLDVPPRDSILNMCFPVFGLMRHSTLLRTGLIRNTPRSDMILLVELSMLGRFQKYPDFHFLRRTHADSSVETAGRGTSRTEKERRLAAWYDPNRGKRFPMTQTKLALGYGRAVLVGRMGPVERVRTLGVYLRWVARNWRLLGGDMKLGLKDWLRPGKA